MKIKMLVAAADNDYIEHLSNYLSEQYADTFEVSVCSSIERLRDLLDANKYDAALLDPLFASSVSLNSIHLSLILEDGSEVLNDSSSGLKKVHKYQRISSIAGSVLENYAVSGIKYGHSTRRARITAVWSPSGGAGKTTVALAYAARRVSSEKQVIYLNLENFSSSPAYFNNNGKSISKAFEKLESNVSLFLTGIRQQDSGSGISYFCMPENYDDINILTVSDIETLINASAVEIDELVIDLSSQCDDRIQKILDLADIVLLICDPSTTSQIKLKQFISQHNVFKKIQSKTVLVNNKGSKMSEANISKTVQLPLVQSVDPISIFKMLSSGNFDW